MAPVIKSPEQRPDRFRISMVLAHNPYGDGLLAERILDVLEQADKER